MKEERVPLHVVLFTGSLMFAVAYAVKGLVVLGLARAPSIDDPNDPTIGVRALSLILGVIGGLMDVVMRSADAKGKK